MIFWKIYQTWHNLSFGLFTSCFLFLEGFQFQCSYKAQSYYVGVYSYNAICPKSVTLLKKCRYYKHSLHKK